MRICIECACVNVWVCTCALVPSSEPEFGSAHTRPGSESHHLHHQGSCPGISVSTSLHLSCSQHHPGLLGRRWGGNDEALAPSPLIMASLLSGAGQWAGLRRVSGQGYCVQPVSPAQLPTHVTALLRMDTLLDSLLDHTPPTTHTHNSRTHTCAEHRDWSPSLLVSISSGHAGPFSEEH